MEEQLKNILRACEDKEKAGRTSFSMGFTHIDRRLHQMLFADRDYEYAEVKPDSDYPPSFRPKIKIERCEEKGYSVVSVNCKDRAKLMFDIVCTLTDMQYVVFHAAISSDGPYASQVSLIYADFFQFLPIFVKHYPCTKTTSLWLMFGALKLWLDQRILAKQDSAFAEIFISTDPIAYDLRSIIFVIWMAAHLILKQRKKG